MSSTGNDRWERVKSAFAEAVELQGEVRATFLESLPADERREVVSLLQGHERTDVFVAPTLVDAEHATRPAARPAAGAVPASIGRYQVIALLGKGGMGEVYRAHDARLDREVALKLLPADLGRQPDRRARFLHEARAAASLNHPNITTIHEIGEADGRDYIALECVQGRTLHELLADHPLTLLELVDIALPLADAVAYAHERGVIHRDIKAANVMVSVRGLPKLLDFGLAKVRLEAPPDPVAAPGAGAAEGARGEPSRTSTLTGTVCGTPGAMSPEQALGEPLDERSDVFSFGSLLYEMACRRPPFAGKTAQDTMNAVIRSEPEPLSKLRPDLPPKIVAIVSRALRKKPADRYARMSELADDLRQFKRQTETGLLPQAQARRGGAGRRVAALLAIALVGLLGWGGWAALHGSRSATDPGGPGQGGAADAAPDELPAPIPGLTAVMHFDNLEDASDQDQLGAMLALLLTTNLSSGSGLQMLSQQRLFEVARRTGSAEGQVDRGNASDVAHHAGVSTMILGQIGHVGEQLVATAELVDVASGRALGTSRAQGKGPDDLFEMAESLRDQVRVVLDAPVESTEERRVINQQLTTSVEAWRNYVIGDQALRGNRTEEAADAFRRAVSIDPAFAMAQFRLAMALTWLGKFGESDQAMERAYAFRERLPDVLRAVLEASRPYHDNDDSRGALPGLLTVVERDPHQRDALYLLGEIYTHSAFNADSLKASTVYGKLLEDDPGFTLIYEHALSALLRRGSFERGREMLHRWRETEPDEAGRLAGVLALWEGRYADAAATLGDRLDIALLARDESSPALARLLASSVDEIVASLSESDGVHLVLDLDLRAGALAYHGRFEPAAELYRRAFAIEGTISPDGFFTSARNAARHHLAFLLAEQGDLAGARKLCDEALDLQPGNPHCLYVSTLVAARQGDRDAARANVAQLDALIGQGWGPAVDTYQQAATAELELAEGHAQQARDRLAALVGAGRLMEDWYAREDSPGPLVREALARAELALGDPAAAAAALDGLLDSGYERLRHPVPWVRALFQRGVLDLDAGRDTNGRAFLELFLASWGDARAADGAELPEVADARARLSLAAGPAR